MNLTLRTGLCLVVLPLAGLVVGCNKAPEQQVAHAENHAVEEHQEYVRKADEMQEKHAVQQAELEKNQAQERAELRSDYRQDTAENRKELVKADANMSADRQAVYAKAKERLEKLDARAELASTKMRTADMKARTEAQPSLDSFRRQRDLAATRIRAVPTVTNETWEQAKKDIDAALDGAEKALGTVESKL